MPTIKSSSVPIHRADAAFSADAPAMHPVSPPASGRLAPGTLPALLAASLLGMTAACTGPEWRDSTPLDPEELAAGHEEWRADRRADLADPDAGVISWIGLWELREGANAFGSDPSLPIVLPIRNAPDLAGTLQMEAGRVRLEPAAGNPVHLSTGEPVTETIPLNDDRSGNTTVLALGTLGFRIHAEPGTERLWLRVWDTALPRLTTFELPPYFPISNDWRVSARFESYPEARTIALADVRGGMVSNQAPGELVFRVNGREHRLIAFATESSSNFFVTLWDSTAVSDTYQGGRYLRVPFADAEGWTTIDFNRTYNAPCVFTPYSVCSLPPRENRLPLAIHAGEKRPLTSF